MSAPRDRPMPWWGAILLTLIMVAAMRGAFVAGAAVKALGRGLPIDEAAELASRDLLTIALAQAAGVMVAIFVGVRWFAPQERLRDAVGLVPVGMGTLGLAAIAGIGLQFPLTEVANLLRDVLPSVFGMSVEEQHAMQRMVAPGTLQGTMIVVASAVLVAPASEELFFRGLLFPGLRAHHGAAVAVALSSVLFGLSHLAPLAVVYASLAGVLLAFVTLRTGSTLPALVMHTAINAVPVILPESILPIPGFNTVSERVYHLPLPWLLGGALVSAAALYGLSRLADEQE